MVAGLYIHKDHYSITMECIGVVFTLYYFQVDAQRHPVIAAGLTQAQWIAIALFGAGLVLLVWKPGAETRA